MAVVENVIARTAAVAFGRGRVYTIQLEVRERGRRRWVPSCAMPACAWARPWPPVLGPDRVHASSPAPLQFHPIADYPEELGVTWEEISGAFTREFVPRLQVRFYLSAVFVGGRGNGSRLRTCTQRRLSPCLPSASPSHLPTPPSLSSPSPLQPYPTGRRQSGHQARHEPGRQDRARGGRQSGRRGGRGRRAGQRGGRAQAVRD